MASTILSEPQPPSMHGVVVQIWTKWSPTGSLAKLGKGLVRESLTKEERAESKRTG